VKSQQSTKDNIMKDLKPLIEKRFEEIRKTTPSKEEFENTCFDEMGKWCSNEVEEQEYTEIVEDFKRYSKFS